MLLELGIGVGVACLMNLFTDSKDDYKKDSEIKTYRELKSLMGNGLTISKNVRLSDKYSNEHVLVVAPSGGYKTRGIIMPSVNRLSTEKCSMVITDPKYEIERECKKGNKKIAIFAPLRPESMGYDPLRNCRNTTEVRKTADMIMTSGNSAAMQMSGGSSDNADWVKKATVPLKAYMLWNYRTKRYTFPRLVERLLSNFPLVVQDIIESNVTEAKVLMNSFLPITKSPTTFACIRNTLLDCLELFLDESVVKMMSKPSINLENLRKEETILYIQVPENESTYFSPLTDVFISQVIDKLIQDEYGLQTYLLLDEFANVNVGKSLSNTLSTCRSRRISVLACIQTINQMEDVYGQKYRTIIELFKTHVYMSGHKVDTAKYASELCGVQKNNKSEIDSRESTLTPDQIIRLSKDESLILCHNKMPIVDRIYKL